MSNELLNSPQLTSSEVRDGLQNLKTLILENSKHQTPLNAK